jgi:hypothetical protein
MIAATQRVFFGTAKIPRGLPVTVFCYFKGTRTMFGRKRNDYLYYPRKRRRSLIGRALTRRRLIPAHG